MSFRFRPGGTKQVVLKQVPYYTAFNPRSIGGCVLWLDAADTSTITGTSPVTAWQDKSGSNNTMTYTGSPTYRTTSDLKLGCITFNGTTSFNSGTDSMYYSGFSVSQPFTVFVVATKRLSSNINYSFVIEPNSGSSSVILYAGLQLAIYAGTANQSTSPVLSFVANSKRIYSAVFNGSSSLLAYDGNATSSLNPGTASWPGVYLGRDWAGTYDSGDYGEILFYNSALGTSQRQQIESYLIQKWGLSGSLPSDHLHNTKPAGIPAVSILNTKGFNLIASLLSGFMSTYYNLSGPYALVNIANSVSANSASIVNIWSVSVPTAAKGKNGILALFFNLYASAFTVGQVFDYGVYIDGVSQLLNDTGTIRYVQSTASTYALSSNGVSLGSNGLVQLLIPVSFLTSASQIQIGLKNSTAGMTPINSALPGYTSNILTATGTINTGNYVPQTLFVTGGSNYYTVPTNTSVGVPTGVYVYLWGCGGQTTHMSGGGGGFVSGYYSCAPGTTLLYVVGSTAGTALFYGGGGSAQNQQGGGFSGIFLSNAGGIAQSNAIAIAGGGGAGVLFPGGDVGSGWGGYPNGGAVNRKINNVFSYSPTITGGTQTAGGLGATTINNGSALSGGPVTDGQGRSGSGGGGWYGGGGNAGGGNGQPGAGGSGYIGNVNGATGGIGLTANAAYENGTDLPLGEFLAGNSVIYTRYPGGRTSPYYASPYGQSSGANPTGAVVIIPAIGTSATQIGVSAALYSG